LRLGLVESSGFLPARYFAQFIDQRVDAPEWVMLTTKGLEAGESAVALPAYHGAWLGIA
jgi:hypothetical protein